MGKERGEHGKRDSKKVEKYADKIKSEKRQAKEDADKIRPILEKDPDWPLVAGIKKPDTQEECDRERRAQTRLTKKAVQLLYPEYKALSCHGTGTAHYWVHVNIVMPEKPEYAESRKIIERADMMLEQVGIKYGGYLPDSLPGKDEWTPCLTVVINDLMWGGY